jgi:hypothetical protein
MPMQRIFDLGIGFVIGYTPTGFVPDVAAGAQCSCLEVIDKRR